MSRLVKCYGQYCEPKGIKHPKDEMYKLGGKNYCFECYEKELADRKEREELYKYIALKYDLRMPTPLQMKHIKEMKENYGWSYKRIMSLIRYCIEKRNFFIELQYGLRGYGNYYSEFIKYVKQNKLLKEKNKGKINKTKSISVDSRNYNDNQYKKNKLFDMEDE